MAFQPFGYRFEIHSRVPPSDAKAAIREKKKRWLDVIDGPRGWIIGPFVCLWSSAFDRYGPMLFGLITEDNLGTRIRGRAGSDLNGILVLAILLLGLLYFLFEIVKHGQATWRWIAVIGVVFALGLLSFWWAHKDRRKADHLVRFIRKVVGEGPAESSIARRHLRDRGPPVKLGVGDRANVECPTAEQIYEALDQLMEGFCAFLILERDDNFYMQSAFYNGEFVIETRDGDEKSHRHAVSPRNSKSRTVTHAQAAETLLLYIEGREVEAPVTWERGYANV